LSGGQFTQTAGRCTSGSGPPGTWRDGPERDGLCPTLHDVALPGAQRIEPRQRTLPRSHAPSRRRQPTSPLVFRRHPIDRTRLSRICWPFLTIGSNLKASR
jgi:hypothetical protein